MGVGRGVWVSTGVGDEGVGDGATEEREVCFGGEEDGRKGVEAMCAAVGVGTGAVFTGIACGKAD